MEAAGEAARSVHHAAGRASQRVAAPGDVGSTTIGMSRFARVASAALVLAVLAGCGGAKREPAVASAPAASPMVRDAKTLERLPKGTVPLDEKWPGGSVKATGYVCDGDPVGPYLVTWPSGAKRAEGTYLYGGVRDGQWSTWAENGRQVSQGGYQRGLEHGLWSYWHDDGTLAARGAFFRAVKEGEWTAWHAKGGLATRGVYLAGQPTGRWQSWTDDGHEASVMTHNLRQ